MAKTFLRKRQVAQRYGNVTPRSIERAIVAGRISAPEYPLGPHIPMWDLAKLEAAERAAVIGGGRPTRQTRLLAELASAPRDQASTILHQHKDSIDALPADEREKLLAAAQGVIAENPKETD